MVACPVCDNRGYLLDDPCPLCDGEGLKFQSEPSEVTTRSSSRGTEDIVSLTNSGASESNETWSNTAHGDYQGKVLGFKSYPGGQGSGSIASDAVPGGTVSFSAKDIVGPLPPNCQKSKTGGGAPAGPAVSFDLRWKKGAAKAVNIRVLDDFASGGHSDAPGAAPLPARSISEEAAPLAPTTEPHRLVERLRRLHGVSSSSFYTSPCANRIGAPESDMHYFLSHEQGADGELPLGYITYYEQTLALTKLRVVVDDPVCAATDLATVLRGFIVDCDLAGVQPMFPCVKADVAATLRQLDFSTTMFGAELALPLHTFELSRRQRQYLRTASNHGLECRTTCTDLDELAQMNEAWLANRPCKQEVVFMTLPPSMPSSGGEDAKQQQDEVRRIFAYQHGRLAGFMEAEPYYRGGKVEGYMLNSTRFLPNPKPCWIPELMFLSLVETLKSGGRAEHLALGFSPCTELRPHLGEITWLRSLFEAMWDSGDDTLYSIHGLAGKKAYYCGDQGVRFQDKFIALPCGLDFSAAARFLVLLFGVDLLKGARKGWFWSWALSTVTGSSPSMPEIVRQPFNCCTDVPSARTDITLYEVCVDQSCPAGSRI